MEYSHIPGHPLSNEERNELKQIMRDCDSLFVRMRAHAILLLFDNHHSFEDVADLFKVHVNTARNWAKRWIALKISGLYDMPGRGAKPKFEEWEEELIIEYAEEEPRSLRHVIEKIERYLGKKSSLGTLRRILKKHGKVWKRQRKITKKQPPKEEYEKKKAELEELKQMADDGDFSLVYFDAAGFF